MQQTESKTKGAKKKYGGGLRFCTIFLQLLIPHTSSTIAFLFLFFLEIFSIADVIFVSPNDAHHGSTIFGRKTTFVSVPESPLFSPKQNQTSKPFAFLRIFFTAFHKRYVRQMLT